MEVDYEDTRRAPKEKKAKETDKSDQLVPEWDSGSVRSVQVRGPVRPVRAGAGSGPSGPCRRRVRSVRSVQVQGPVRPVRGTRQSGPATYLVPT